MDYPQAWAFVKETKLEDHHEKCSWRTTNGALLCDCDVIRDEYVKRGGTDPRVRAAHCGLILVAVLLIVGTVIGGWKSFWSVDNRPAPSGNCDLWIKDDMPTFVCVDQGEATAWRLHRNGRWQYIGPATNSNLGVNQG